MIMYVARCLRLFSLLFLGKIPNIVLLLVTGASSYELYVVAIFRWTIICFRRLAIIRSWSSPSKAQKERSLRFYSSVLHQVGKAFLIWIGVWVLPSWMERKRDFKAMVCKIVAFRRLWNNYIMHLLEKRKPGEVWTNAYLWFFFYLCHFEDNFMAMREDICRTGQWLKPHEENNTWLSM